MGIPANSFRFFICHSFLVPKFTYDGFSVVKSYEVNEFYSLIVAVSVNKVPVEKMFKEITFTQAKNVCSSILSICSEIEVEKSAEKVVATSDITAAINMVENVNKICAARKVNKTKKKNVGQMYLPEIMKVKSAKSQSVFNTIRNMENRLDGRIQKSIRLQNSLKTQGVFSENWS